MFKGYNKTLKEPKCLPVAIYNYRVNSMLNLVQNRNYKVGISLEF